MGKGLAGRELGRNAAPRSPNKRAGAGIVGFDEMSSNGAGLGLEYRVRVGRDVGFARAHLSLNSTVALRQRFGTCIDAVCN